MNSNPLIDLIPTFLVVEIILALIALGAAVWSWASANAAEKYAKEALWAPRQERDSRGRFLPRHYTEGPANGPSTGVVGTASGSKYPSGSGMAEEEPEPPTRLNGHYFNVVEESDHF